MSKNINSFLVCPIPEDQKPFQAYLLLKESWLLRWTTFSTLQYQKRLVLLSLLFFFFISLFNFPFSQESAYWLERVVLNFLASFLFLLFLLTICYFRWKEIEKKFLETILSYEEGSWYTSQQWKKPFLIQETDQKICEQKVIPILQRLLRTMYLLSCFSLGSFLFLQFQ